MTSELNIELPPKLIPVFTGEARYRGAYGGRGSAKTRSFAKMAAVRGLMFAAEGRTGIILCGREFMNSLSESSMAEVKAAIADEPWLAENYDVGERYIRTNCRTVEFHFAGLRHNLDSIKSKARILLAWVDEAEPVSETAWVKLIPTVREEGSEIWLTWNPERDNSATHRRFREDPPEGAKIVEINWRDNPWFPKVLNQERLEDQAKRPELYQHIWEGDFDTVIEGAYYAATLNELEQNDQITDVPHDPSLAVHTAWDIGVGDSTAIWFYQQSGTVPRIIDFFQADGEGAPFYVDMLESGHRKKYRYGNHYMPHDITHREFGTGRSRIEVLEGLGIKSTVVPRLLVDDGINAVRMMLPMCVFDATRCKEGLECLRYYRSEYDETRRIYKPKPVHDWTSHAADAFRYLAVSRPNQGERITRTKDYGYKGKHVPRQFGSWAAW